MYVLKQRKNILKHQPQIWTW